MTKEKLWKSRWWFLVGPSNGQLLECITECYSFYEYRPLKIPRLYASCIGYSKNLLWAFHPCVCESICAGAEEYRVQRSSVSCCLFCCLLSLQVRSGNDLIGMMSLVHMFRCVLSAPATPVTLRRRCAIVLMKGTFGAFSDHKRGAGKCFTKKPTQKQVLSNCKISFLGRKKDFFSQWVLLINYLLWIWSKIVL